MTTIPNTLFEAIERDVASCDEESNLPFWVHDNVTMYVAHDLVKNHPELGGDPNAPMLRHVAAIVARYLVAQLRPTTLRRWGGSYPAPRRTRRFRTRRRGSAQSRTRSNDPPPQARSPARPEG
jgi:hypothetical protein